MQPTDARIILQINDENPSREAIEAAYEARHALLEDRLDKAPTENLRHKYRSGLEELATARQVLLRDVSASADAGTGGVLSTAPVFEEEDAKSAAGAQIQLPGGTILVDRFEIRERLGSGMTGAVFRAYDRSNRQEVAIKVLAPSLVAGAEAALQDTVRQAASLSHPNVIETYGLHRDTQRGLSFISMALLRGKSLRQEIDEAQRSGTPLSWARLRPVFLQACDALQFASTTMLHGGLRPENIWITADGAATITDFGLIQCLGAAAEGDAAKALVSAPYVAPEVRVDGQASRAAADVYGLGAVLYEALGNQMPVAPLIALGKLRSDLPRGLARAVSNAMNSDPGKRTGSIAELKVALGKIQAGVGASGNSEGKGSKPLVLALVALLVLAGAGSLYVFKDDVTEMAESFLPDPEVENETIRLHGENAAQRDWLEQYLVTTAERLEETRNRYYRLRDTATRGTRDAAQARAIASELEDAEMQLAFQQAISEAINSGIMTRSDVMAIQGQQALIDTQMEAEDLAAAGPAVRAVNETYRQARVDIEAVEPALIAQSRAQGLAAELAGKARRAQEAASVRQAFDDAQAAMQASAFSQAVPLFEGYLKDGASYLAYEQAAASTNPAIMRRYIAENTGTDRAIDVAMLLEEHIWRRAQAQGNPAAWRSYLASYPDGLYAEEAQAALDGVNSAAASRTAQIKAIQTELNRVGFNIGDADGQIDDLMIGAIDQYNWLKGVMGEASVDSALLARLKTSPAMGVTMGSVVQDCPFCPPMVVLRGGWYTPVVDGEEKAEQAVMNIIAIGQREITRGEFASFVRATGYQPRNGCYTQEDFQWRQRPDRNWQNPGFAQGDDHPAVCISFEDAQTYALWLGSVTGRPYRLLSEAEWAYAASASANMPTASSAYLADGTMSVHSSLQNDLGIAGLADNAAEWLADCWTSRPFLANMSGSASRTGKCEDRTIRGGSWNDGSRGEGADPYARTGYEPSTRSSLNGFRVATDMAPRLR